MHSPVSALCSAREESPEEMQGTTSNLQNSIRSSACVQCNCICAHNRESHRQSASGTRPSRFSSAFSQINMCSVKGGNSDLKLSLVLKDRYTMPAHVS